MMAIETSTTEHPINFLEKRLIGGYIIEYRDLYEVGQGGPSRGRLYVNNKLVSKNDFGAPFLYENGILYIPFYVKYLFSSGYSLAILDLSSLSLKRSSKLWKFIWMHKKIGDSLFFKTDMAGLNDVEIDLSSLTFK